MRNDELKHYGVKGMKWRQHKYKTREGDDGDYGYNYGNNNGSNNSGSKYPYFDKDHPLSPYNTARDLHNLSNKVNRTANKASKRDTYRDTYNPFHKEYKWDSAYQTSWKGGYQSNRKAQKAVKRASGKALNGSNKYKVVNMYSDEPVRPANALPPVQKRHSRKRSSGSGTRTTASTKKPVEQEFGVMSKDKATTRRQNRQKAKNSAEVRAKTLGEALGKVGRSASANSPMGKHKLRNQSGQAARDVMGRAVSKGKHTAKGAHELSSQYKRNKRGVETALGLGKTLNLKKDVQSFLKKNGKKAMPKSLQKKSAANKRKKQIEDAKNWVSSKLNDANSLFNNFKTKRKVKGAAKKVAKNSKKVARSTSNLTKSSAAKDAKRWVDSKLRDAGRAYDNAKKEFNSYRAKKKTSKAAKKATSSLKKTSKGLKKTTKNARLVSTTSTNGVKRYSQSELAGYKARSSAEAIRKATRNKSIPEGVKRMSNSEKSAYNVSRSAQQFTNNLSKSFKKKKKRR